MSLIAWEQSAWERFNDNRGLDWALRPRRYPDRDWALRPHNYPGGGEELRLFYGGPDEML